MGKQFDIAIPHATLLAIFAAVLTLGIPPWLTNSLLLWLFWSLIALLYMSEPPRRDFVQGTLRHPKFTQIYRVSANWAVNWFWSRYCDESYEGDKFFKTFQHALTWRLYDKALLIAVVYPVWLLVILWIITGNYAKLGDAIVLPAAKFWPDRVTTLGIIAIIFLGINGKYLAASSRHHVIRQVADWLPFLALAITFAIAFTYAIAFELAIAGAMTGALAILFAIAIAFAIELAIAGIFVIAFAFAYAYAMAFEIAFAFAYELVIAFAFAFAMAFAFAFAIEILDKKNKPQLTRWLVTLMLPLGWIILLITLSWADITEQSRAIFLFLGVLPLINALFDVVSYAVTLTLLRLGLSGRHPILNGVLDLAIAMALFLALGACLTALITAMNALAGTPLFDLDALFDGIRDPQSDYTWLYLMMFSTLLPTAMHLALAVLGLQALTPRFIRRRVANLVKASPDRAFEATLAPLAVGAVWSVPFLLIGWGVYFCWHYFGGWIASIGWFYLDTLSALALVLGNG